MKKFSISEALSFGWNTTKANIVFLIVIGLIYGAISYIPGLITGGMGAASDTSEANPMLLIVQIGLGIVQLALGIGFLRICLKFVDGQKPVYQDLFFFDLKTILFVFVGGLLNGIMVFFGLLLFIIPGIIIGLTFSQYMYLIVDKNLGPIDALKKSAEITKGVKMDLFLFWLVAIGITILGMLAFFVGLFVAIPVIYLASVYIYRKLV